jgi:hypothetical protein
MPVDQNPTRELREFYSKGTLLWPVVQLRGP